MTNKPEKKEIDIVEIWRVVVKRRWIIAASAAIVVIAAAVLSFTKTPLFRARATILIGEPSSSMLNISDIYRPYYRSNYIGTYFNTQLNLLASRSLAERVSRRMNLASRREFQTLAEPRKSLFQTAKNILTFRWIRPAKREEPEQEPSDTDSVPSWIPQDPNSMYASLILGRLSISPVEETRIVGVSYTSPSPVLAADIVNALAEEFLIYSVETRSEATRQASDFLSEQIAQLRDDLTAKEKDLQKYGEEKKILFLREKESTVVNKFSDLNSALTGAQIDRLNKEVKYRELKSLNVDSMPQSVSSSIIQSLKTEYARLKNDYDVKSNIFKPSYPEMIKLKTQLDNTKKELESEIEKAVEAAEIEYRTARNKEASLANMLESQRTDVVKMNNNAILYNSLKIEVENKRSLLNSLVAKQNETEVSARIDGLKTSTVKIIDKAMIPRTPFSPNHRRSLLMALFLGLFGGIGLGFLIEYLDNTVKTPEEVEKLAGLPSLGVIPCISRDGIKKRGYYSPYSYSYGQENTGSREDIPEVKKVELVNHLHPRFAISEVYRTIRTSILFAKSESPPQSIAFSSAVPQEGKSATVTNMAISFSQLENRVLVIDGDMRRPRLHKIFKVRNMRGLSTYLTGKAALEEVVHETSIENIWLLPSGPHPPNPTELLNSKKMKELMKEVREKFDTILVDSPPALAVTDPVIISSLSDCTVLVIRAGKTPRKSFLSAIEEIKKASAPIVGVVFNEMKVRKNGYYPTNYHHYMDEYYEESADEDTTVSEEGAK